MNENLTTTNHYDYIIAGAGCAGLSLLLRILNEPTLKQKTILLIDADLKQTNDRTWCFWEKEKGFFENLVSHQWQDLVFKVPNKIIKLEIEPYSYKKIKAIDFYNQAWEIINKNKQVTFLRAKVEAIETIKNQVIVIANKKKFTANYVFNSILLGKELEAFNQTKKYKLLQHFKGWEIQSEIPMFKPKQAYFMDFSVPQNFGTTFVYVLPTTETTALIEYTFFNQELLPTQEEYNNLLKEYIKTELKVTNYKILEVEYGVIPMTNHTFNSIKGNVINIGTAGGWTKPSSGFTFMFIQKHTKCMVEQLKVNKFPKVNKLNKKFFLYDSTLLNVLHNKKMEGKEIFYQLFKKQSASLVLKFLDNETSILEDIKIQSSVSTVKFLPAAIKELIKMIKN